MPYETGVTRTGPFKKKSLDYIVPAAVYRHLAGNKITREAVEKCIAGLYTGSITTVKKVQAPTTAPTPVASPAPQVEVSQVATSHITENAPRPTLTITPGEISSLKSQSTLSIAHLMAMQKKTEEKKEENSTHQVLKNPFNQSELSRLWVVYSSRVKEESRQMLYSAMNDARLTLKEDFKIEIEVVSSISAGYIEEEMLSIIEFLKKELSNECITHSIKVVAEKREELPYTPIEKYQYLLAKNPQLEEMRKKLKLNIEF
jgi:DNA polymerase-3 subunit gamma/tau